LKNKEVSSTDEDAKRFKTAVVNLCGYDLAVESILAAMALTSIGWVDGTGEEDLLFVWGFKYKSDLPAVRAARKRAGILL